MRTSKLLQIMHIYQRPILKNDMLPQHISYKFDGEHVSKAAADSDSESAEHVLVTAYGLRWPQQDFWQQNAFV